jgi:hypothetical protein
LQVAFEGSPDSEIPSDHAIWAVLGDMADMPGQVHRFRFNVRTETHLPRAGLTGISISTSTSVLRAVPGE